ncbi:MAG: BF3164 family lipoprotein [Bacteroidales bacterium]|nr:BF3164 family lipoprotein [Bacteroidales bacterium]
MKKRLFFFGLGVILFSCAKQPDYPYIDLSLSTPLSNPKPVLRFENKLPYDLAIKDSLAVLLFSKEDTCGAVYNLNTKKPAGYFGMVGNGPGEVMRIEFVANKQYALDRDSLYFFDTNQGRLMAISLKMPEKGFVLHDVSNSPNILYRIALINLTHNFLVAKSISANEMFFIHHRKTGESIGINYFPEVSGIGEIYKSAFYTPRLGINESKGKIIMGTTLMDMIQVYDTQGERKKIICFSKKYIPPVKDQLFDTSEESAGIYLIFPTEKYCYIIRRIWGKKERAPQITQTETDFLLKMDWEGNLISSYAVQNDFRGIFIDEKLNRFYCIQNTIGDHHAEYYDVVYYDLN